MFINKSIVRNDEGISNKASDSEDSEDYISEVFAPKLKNVSNNCFANTCFTILGSTPHGFGQINRFIHQSTVTGLKGKFSKLCETIFYYSICRFFLER